MGFDIDKWVELYKDDPEAFEAKRLEAIQQLIGQFSGNQHKLNKLQFHLDMVRKQSKNPMDSCIAISEMMIDSFKGDLSLALEKLNTSQITDDIPPKKSAVILSFPTKE